MIKTIPFSQATIASFIVFDAAANQTVRVLGYTLSAAGAVSVTWNSAANAISGPMPMIAGVPLSAPMVATKDFPHLICNKGEDLKLALSATVAVGGHVTIDVETDIH
jgi:hypothetical protein